MHTIHFDDDGRSAISQMRWDDLGAQPSLTLELAFAVQLPYRLPREMSFTIEGDGGAIVPYRGIVLSQSDDGREVRITKIRERES